jgi:hypothetical protein
MLSVNYAECRKQVHYAECRCAKCRYAECHGANTLAYAARARSVQKRFHDIDTR